MEEDPFESRVTAFRRFNRFFTRRIGILDRSYLGSGMSLAEVRILYELAFREGLTASALCRDLGLDAGYVSRTLKRFRQNGLLERAPSPEDGRRNVLSLTDRGHAVFRPLFDRSRREIAALLSPLPPPDQERLTGAMREIEALLEPSGLESPGLEPPGQPVEPCRLRPPEPGDMGWVIGAHGRIYAEEFGWDRTFEAMVADVAAAFIRDFDPAWERGWIAERRGQPVGSVLVVRRSPEVAKLRLLIVDPSARGLGLGARLVNEAMQFARETGYGRMTLWTNDVLVAARRIYERAGFTLVASEPHHSFGQDLVGETWELAF